MRPYDPSLYDDAALLAEFQAYRAALKKLATGDIAVIAGEDRRLEFAPGEAGVIRDELREIGCEARRRGLCWGGEGGSIAVEIS